LPLVLDRRRFILGSGAAALAAALPAAAQRRVPAYPEPDRELMVPVRGGRVYVRVNGRLDGPRPPIVLLHGGPGGTHASLLDALALADERAVVLYDQLDSGRSDRTDNPANWTVERFTSELDSIRRALGIRRWHVAGHSWGATIALEYGARRPAALAGLVLAGPLVSTRSWIADANALRARLPADVRATLDRCDPPAPVTPACETATAAFYAQYNRREPPNEATSAYRRTRLGRGSNDRIYEAMWGRSEFIATGTLKDYDGEPLLSRLPGNRTLFMVGQYDEALPSTVEGFALRTPGSDFAVVPGAAHGMFSDRPEETLGILRPWLRRQDAAPSNRA
jgi:proline iminopeptidase/L-proline amide hydrolase